MSYKDFRNLPRSTAFEKTSSEETFNIAKDPKYDRYHRSFASIVYKFFDTNAFAKSYTPNRKVILR